jgi:CubicO group peptidase (beta-lactamase class C family)
MNAGQPHGLPSEGLPGFLAERVLGPLGMSDTAFEVPPSRRERFTSHYRTSGAGALRLADAPDGQWSAPPVFPLGNGGLAGTIDDWALFARMLLAEGTAADGRRLLTKESVRLTTTDHTSAAQRADRRAVS